MSSKPVGRSKTMPRSFRRKRPPGRGASVSAILVAGLLVSLVPATSALAQDAGEDAAKAQAAEHGFEAGDVVVRARMSGVLPYDVRSHIDVIGGRVDVPRMVLPDMDVSYFLTDRLAITGQTGALKTRFSVRDTIFGDIDVGSVWAVPVGVSFEYHVLPDARFNPYVGLGAVATWYTGAKSASPLVKDFRVDPQLSPVFRVGLDVRMTETWFANTEMRLVLPPTQVLTNSGVTARTDVKSLTLGFGVSYRF